MDRYTAWTPPYLCSITHRETPHTQECGRVKSRQHDASRLEKSEESAEQDGRQACAISHALGARYCCRYLTSSHSGCGIALCVGDEMFSVLTYGAPIASSRLLSQAISASYIS